MKINTTATLLALGSTASVTRAFSPIGNIGSTKAEIHHRLPYQLHSPMLSPRTPPRSSTELSLFGELVSVTALATISGAAGGAVGGAITGAAAGTLSILSKTMIKATLRAAPLGPLKLLSIAATAVKVSALAGAAKGAIAGAAIAPLIAGARNIFSLDPEFDIIIQEGFATGLEAGSLAGPFGLGNSETISEQLLN